MKLSQIIADLSVQLSKLKAEVRYINQQKKEIQEQLDRRIAEYQLQGDILLDEENKTDPLNLFADEAITIEDRKY